MLEYMKNGESIPLDYDQYYIQEEWDGWEDTLRLSLPVKHPQRPDLVERLPLTDRDSGQVYVITSIDEGVNTADITAALDLDELRADMLLAYSNGSATAGSTVQSVLPAGWSLIDYSGLTIRRTIEFDGATPLDVIEQCVSTYKGLAVRFDRKTRQVLLYYPAANEPSGACYTDELNLTERPQFKGAATDFYTRLYPVGADGLTISAVNGGTPYVECHDYTDAVISRYWKDERYTDPNSLLDDATEMVKEAAVPARSYTCAIADLAKIDPARYGHLSAQLYQVVTLMDREHKARVQHKVAQYCRYPHYPERNVITLSTVPGKLTSRVQTAYSAVTDTAGTTSFSQRQSAAIAAATAWLTNGKGYKVERLDGAGNVVDTLYMDTPDIATAVNVLRIGQSGIGFSNNGVNGPYTNFWTLDGKFNATCITTGTLNADLIRAGTMLADRILGGTLTLGGLNNKNGVFVMLDADGDEIGRWDNNGVNINGGQVRTIKTDPDGVKPDAFSDVINGQFNCGVIQDGTDMYTSRIATALRNGEPMGAAQFFLLKNGEMQKFCYIGFGTDIMGIEVYGESGDNPRAAMLADTANDVGSIRLRDSSGDVKARLDGDGTMRLRDAAQANTILFNGATGSGAMTGTLTQGSDRRLKSAIRDVPDELIDAYLTLAPRLYTLNASGKECAGLIAQEVQGTPLEDLLVVRREDSDLLMLDYTSLHALELAALQRMHTRLTALEARNGG